MRIAIPVITEWEVEYGDNCIDEIGFENKDSNSKTVNIITEDKTYMIKKDDLLKILKILK